MCRLIEKKCWYIYIIVSFMKLAASFGCPNTLNSHNKQTNSVHYQVLGRTSA